MKVLQVYRTYFPDSQGGGEEAIRQICLGTSGVAEHRIFTPSQSPSPQVLALAEGEVHRSRLDFEISSCGFTFSGISQFRKLYRWADIVHFHFPWPFADVLEILSDRSKPMVVTYHSDIVRQRLFGMLYRPLREHFLRRADALVCTSPDYLRTSPILRNHADKTQVIPLGLDEDSYPTPSKETVASMQSRFGEGFFFFVGVHRYYKGLDVLLNASRDQRFKVVIAGDGPLTEKLREKKHALQLDNVEFAGRVTDEEKMALLQLSLAVVFPSLFRSEAFGITLLEGAMSSRALISTDVGTGTSYANIDGETGRVVAPDDVQQLRDAMLAMFADKPATKAMGQAARARFDAMFTGQIVGQQYVALYESLNAA